MRRICMLLCATVMAMAPFTAAAVEPAAETGERKLAVLMVYSKEHPRFENRKNIFTFHLYEPERKEYFRGYKFDIDLYVDAQYIKTFEKESLPFDFARNFQGRFVGSHSIRVDFKNPEEDKILATQQITVVVEP